MKYLYTLVWTGCLFLLFTSPVKAQQQHSEAQQPKLLPAAWGISGQILGSTDGQSLYVSAGGPAIRLSNKKAGVSLIFLPSLRYSFDKEITHNGAKKAIPLLQPALGMGLQCSYGRFLFALPCYFRPEIQQWTLCAGAGVRLGGK